MTLRLLVPKSSLQIGVPVYPPIGGWLPPCVSGGPTQVTLLDFALDASGKLIRVAADVDQTCSTAPNTTKVSVRYNSPIALRP